MSKRQAIIIGAGPAGLTAALELLRQTDIQPVILEKSDAVGGLSRTVEHHGNRLDIGGHRFFSKSDRVTDFWLDIMPLESSRAAEGRGDLVMLKRERRSSILFSGKSFPYPIRLDVETLSKLGLGRTLRIGFSYLKSSVLPIKPEANLEQFFVNRFGRELYRTFFKDYTEKVWGVPCDQISSAWGAQRVKGLSLAKAALNFLSGIVRPGRGNLAQKEKETSLIDRFMYPKLGPGQLWNAAADRVRELGGTIITGASAVKFNAEGGRVRSVVAEDLATGGRRELTGDLFFSTMPVRDLVAGFSPEPPPGIREIAAGLSYRDFIAVGLKLSGLKVAGADWRDGRDNWVYIQEPFVKAGRIQIFNNWSPDLAADRSKPWVGLEYFCTEGDGLWNLPDREMVALAGGELEALGMIGRRDVEDGTVVRQTKAYPAYLGSYAKFDVLRAWLDRFPNLFLIGRNGMHRYNNMDHSMLTAMEAVRAAASGSTDKGRIWSVNAEADYHESASATKV